MIVDRVVTAAASGILPVEDGMASIDKCWFESSPRLPQNTMTTTNSLMSVVLRQLAEARAKPPEPTLSDAELAALDPIRRAILSCNVPGCRHAVSTHGMLCVDHTLHPETIPQHENGHALLQDNKSHPQV